MVLCCSWWFLDGSLWFLVVLDNSLEVLSCSLGSWEFLVIPGGSLWFLVVLGDLGGSWWSFRWFLVVLGGS